MPVHNNHWRAAIGLLRLLKHTNIKLHLQIKPLSVLLSISKLYIFCCILVLISIPVLPLTLFVQIAINFFFSHNIPFLQLFAWMYKSIKAIAYVLFMLTKYFPPLCLVSLKRPTLKFLFLRCASLFATCLLCNMLHLQWITYNKVIMSGDIETNPGPNCSTLNFCSWNLNSICAQDFARIPLIEAYNSVYNYDLVGIVEIHLNDTIDCSKLDINGYTFMNSNHLHNVKRGGVGLYVRNSFPVIRREDLAVLPECIVCEIHLDNKKYFFTVLYRSPSQSQTEFQGFKNNFEVMLSRMTGQSPYTIRAT